MKVFLFHNPFDERFARISALGTWVGGSYCRDCTTTTGQKRVSPLVIEWEPDSDLIGDFVWVDFGLEIVITERVAKALKENFHGFELGPVKMFQDPRLKRPKRITKRTKPRVWLPYEGPPVYDLMVTVTVPMDRERTTVEVKKKCQTCGNEISSIVGVERVEGRMERRGEDFVIIRTGIPRVPGQGLFVRKKDLQGADIFGVDEFGGRERTGWTLCTERVKTFIEKEGFTNVRFLEYGDVI